MRIKLKDQQRRFQEKREQIKTRYEGQNVAPFKYRAIGLVVLALICVVSPIMFFVLGAIVISSRIKRVQR